ncbi:MAG TPA: HAMP domain-containing sensor histidine kinase [Thermoanaerobaculia bacterium]
MCGTEIPSGILCEKCDKPRKPRADGGAAAQPATRAAASEPSVARTENAHALDPFPKAPIVPFPVEAASPAITSVVNVLVAAGVPSILLGPDKSVKFISDEAKALFEASLADLASVRFIEEKTGLRIGDLSVPTSAGMRIRDRNILYSLVPMSGGAGGAVLVFRPTDPIDESHASFITYVRETVFGPLRSMRESLLAASQTRPSDPLLDDSAGTLEQILSSLELAPGISERSTSARPVPTVTEVVRRVADRFIPHADLKAIRLQVDVQDLDARLADHDQLGEALAILMDNALHYVPAGGQVVIGVRWMEHKQKPLLLFFVMDNGPLVPESLRHVIFEPSFVWNAAAPERTGRGLFRCREFAVNHGGAVWAESKTGKACTFFLRVRPDNSR